MNRTTTLLAAAAAAALLAFAPAVANANQPTAAKLASPQAQSSTTHEVGGGEVHLTRQLPGGVTQITDLIAVGDPAVLADMLAKNDDAAWRGLDKGMRDSIHKGEGHIYSESADGEHEVTAVNAHIILSEPGISGSRAYDATCDYGNARAWLCPRVTWKLNGFANPNIYYADNSSSIWPQGTAITKWNTSPNIHVVWQSSGSCPNITGTHCVLVNDANWGDTHWAGDTNAYSSGGYFVDSRSATIDYNDYYTLTASQRLNTACHETGHSIGLGHNASITSCLYYKLTDTGYSTVPNADDFSELAVKLYP